MKFPCNITLKSKFGDVLYLAESEEDVKEIALDILKFNFEGFWDESDDMYSMAQRVIKEENGPLAWKIVIDRSSDGYVYEQISINLFENRQ